MYSVLCVVELSIRVRSRAIDIYEDRIIEFRCHGFDVFSLFSFLPRSLADFAVVSVRSTKSLHRQYIAHFRKAILNRHRCLIDKPLADLFRRQWIAIAVPIIEKCTLADETVFGRSWLLRMLFYWADHHRILFRNCFRRTDI